MIISQIKIAFKSKEKWKISMACLMLLLLNIQLMPYAKPRCGVVRNVKDIWLKGESAPVPFASQIFAVYSFAPVSFIFQTNLILGDLYSRKIFSSSTQPTVSAAGASELAGASKGAMTAVAFSSFFDVRHFVAYWAKHKKAVITSQDSEICLAGNRTIVKIKRVPDFFPIQKSEFSSLLGLSKVKFPFQSNQTVVIDSPNKFVALYWFWNDLPMLQYVHTSLKPAPQIDRFVQAILKELPRGFVAIHVRLDSGSMAALANSSSAETKSTFVQHILDSHCLSEVAKFDNSFVDPPPIYLVTNAIGHHHHHHTGGKKRPGASLSTGSLSSNADDKARLLMTELSSLGFHLIHTKTTLTELITMKLLEKSFEGKPVGGDANVFHRLLPEQLTYIDMLVSRASSCFIPSHIPTTFSYLVERFRKFDKNIYEPYENINNATYGSLSMYRQWGF